MNKTFLTVLISVTLLCASCGKTPTPNGDHADSSSSAHVEDYYTCPMHPQVHKDKPGVCPICGMDLVKASNSSTTGSETSAGVVTLDERGQLLANVATTKVAFDNVQQVVRAFGNLVIPEPRKVIISARFGGRIEKLYVDAAGASVEKGDPLFDVYSPDIIQAENEYLQVFTPGAFLAGGDGPGVKSKLKLMGLTDQQIHELESSRTVSLVTTYHSPAKGTVMTKKITTGSYVSEGAILYELSDLSTLWNLAEVNVDLVGLLHVGDTAMISIGSGGGKAIKGTVSFVYPVVDDQSRNVKVRLLVNNADGKLRPNTYTETSFLAKAGKGFTVPVSAVLLTGKRNLVYVRTDNGNHFVAREVGLGPRFGNKYVILWGLSEGEEVVSEGGYLIDSESQLRSGDGPGHQHE
jgi:membrane fusion protein, copper/silver efflux system